MQYITDDDRTSILLQSSYDTILHLCQTDHRYATLCQQLHHDPSFWKLLIERDFPTLTTHYTKQAYELLHHFFRTYTLNIIKEGLSIPLLHMNLPSIFDQIYWIVVDYIILYKKYQNKLVNVFFEHKRKMDNQISELLGSSRSYWLNMEYNYNIDVDKKLNSVSKS